MKYLVPTLCLALLSGALSAGSGPRAEAKAATRIFAGKVLDVEPKSRSFTMRAGSSRRVEKVRVQVTLNTAWKGEARKGLPRVGDAVLVTAQPAQGGLHAARSIRVSDPRERPKIAIPKTMRRR